MNHSPLSSFHPPRRHVWRVSFIALMMSIGSFFASPLAHAEEEPAGALLQQGALHDQKFEAAAALQCYCAAQKLEPKDANICVSIARQYRHLMTDASTKAEKLRLGHLALDYSKMASGLDPKNPEAQLAVGITYGKMMPFLGTKEQVDACPRIKSAADATLRLDSQNDTAWHILGRWNRILADVSSVKRALAGMVYGSLPKGTNEEAAKCLEKAVALNPNRLMHYIELGRVYSQMGRKEDARRFILKGLAMTNTEKDDPESKQLGREELKKLQ
jgi:tetratricopeptide (TPR) repeat protein